MNMQIVQELRFHPQTELFQLLSPQGFVDTGVEMPIGGRVYLSRTTSYEVGRLWGMITRDEADAKDLEIATLKATVESLARHLKERDPLFQALKAAIADDSPIEALV